jgi:hypothetical protein
MNRTPDITMGPGMTAGAGTAPTPVPLHDIVGPLPFFSGPLWVIVAVLFAVAFGGGLLWWFAGRKKNVRLTPREAALRDLARLRASLTEGTDHSFGVGVSDVLRCFLGEALGLAAPRQTTEEFLESLRGSLRFLPSEQEALAEFLHHADYMKFAQGEATSEQREALIVAAEAFVRSGEKTTAEQVASVTSSEMPGKEAV